MQNPLSLRPGLLAVFVLFFSASAAADNSANWGPALGTSMPDGLTLTTQDDKQVDPHTLASKNGVAIAFVRSADWCPFCKRQLIELNKSREEFAKRGIALVALSYDSVEILKEFATRQGIGYTLLSDPDSTMIDALGIRNEGHDQDSSGWGIPHPGIMVFDANCALVAKFAEEGYRKRPPVEDILAAIDRNLAQ